MHEPVNGGKGHGLIGEDAAPFSHVASHRLFTCRHASACQECQGQQPEPTPSVACCRVVSSIFRTFDQATAAP